MTTLSPDTKSGLSVQMYEYQEPSTLELVTQNVAHAPAHVSSGSDNLDQRIAEAHAQGVREGMMQAQQTLGKQLESERTTIATIVQGFERQLSGYYAKVEVELVHLALGIAAKILHREAQVDRMLVAGLVKVALEKLQQSTRVTVHVRPENVTPWIQYFQEQMAGRIHIDVKPNPSLAANNCVLETELGTTELGIETQLKEIEKGFFDLLAQRPEGK
ncbi:MAG TPA: FliH/SctL family protein [Terriglobales bacterium]|jgi:flagellar assembly protein FliH